MVKKERTNADGLGILGLLDDPRYHRAEARSMSQLIPSLLILVEPFRSCFARPEVFQTFQTLIAGWIVCLGPRTLSEVWQATGLAAKRHRLADRPTLQRLEGGAESTSCNVPRG